MLTSEVAVLKSRHGISVKCSRYRDTGPTDPSLILNPRLSSIYLITGESAISPLVMTPLIGGPLPL